jgi:phosphoribosyl 1,2-cyclic phosphodiesterase
MSLFISALASGSNGNCYYIGNNNEAVLIDAGISCRETERRMSRQGLRIDKVKAIFISHEHTDHTRGVEVISKKYNIPVYITAATHGNSRLWLHPGLTVPFSSNAEIRIGNLKVHPFPKHHDASEPHSFTVNGNGITVGVFTDIGRACENLTTHLGRCHAAFLEANYDEEMLEKGNYPVYLKRRIRGDDGHLSNRQALELFSAHRAPFLSLLVLSHLSANNNSPELVKDLFNRHAGGATIVVASRYEEMKVFKVEEGKKEE